MLVHGTTKNKSAYYFARNLFSGDPPEAKQKYQVVAPWRYKQLLDGS